LIEELQALVGPAVTGPAVVAVVVDTLAKAAMVVCMHPLPFKARAKAVMPTVVPVEAEVLLGHPHIIMVVAAAEALHYMACSVPIHWSVATTVVTPGCQTQEKAVEEHRGPLVWPARGAHSDQKVVSMSIMLQVVADMAVVEPMPVIEDHLMCFTTEDSQVAKVQYGSFGLAVLELFPMIRKQDLHPIKE
jgi:hypothetical protein